MKGNFPKYPEYNALCDYHRRCLVATNYWRVINGEKPISVPPEDAYYYKYFDPRCFEIRKQKVAEMMGASPKAASKKAAQPVQEPAAPAHKPAPKDPANCTAHAPMPDGQGGFKCERCGTELKSKVVTNVDPTIRAAQEKTIREKAAKAGKAPARAPAKAEVKPETKPIKPKQAELF